MSEHTSLVFPHWAQLTNEALSECTRDRLRLRGTLEAILALDGHHDLIDAQNIARGALASGERGK